MAKRAGSQTYEVKGKPRRVLSKPKDVAKVIEEAAKRRLQIKTIIRMLADSGYQSIKGLCPSRLSDLCITARRVR